MKRAASSALVAEVMMCLMMCAIFKMAPLLGGVCMGREEEVAAGTASSIRVTEVAGITVCSEYHVAGMVSDDGIFLCCKVV